MSKILPQKFEMAEDEIDLRDYIDTIVKRKKTILSVFLVSVILTTIISFILPKIYLSTAVIQTGIVVEPLMNKAEAEETIKSSNLLNPIIEELGLDAKVEIIKSLIQVEGVKDAGFLRINVEYPGRDKSLAFCRSIAGSFLAKTDKLYQERLNLLRQRIEELDSQINSIKSDIQSTQSLAQSFSASKKISETEAVRIIILGNTLSNYKSNLTNLLNQKYGLQLTLSHAKEFKLTDLLTSPKPVRPKTQMNLLIFGFSGLMLGVFVAFFQEYWTKSTESQAV